MQGRQKVLTPELTVIVPVYNEAGTLRRLLASLARLKDRVEIIAVDDGSADGSGEILAESVQRRRRPFVRLIRHDRNRGKGSAVRAGLGEARGRFVVVQDADLETDPGDIRRLLATARKFPDLAVFGTRFPPRRGQRPRPGVPAVTRAANALITMTANLLFGSALTDIACAYKMLPRPLIRSLALRAERFEIEAEITAGLLTRGIRIMEVPVRYRPRRYSEGKKIHPLDGLRILLTLLSLRVARQRRP